MQRPGFYGENQLILVCDPFGEFSELIFHHKELGFTAGNAVCHVSAAKNFRVQKKRTIRTAFGRACSPAQRSLTRNAPGLCRRDHG